MESIPHWQARSADPLLRLLRRFSAYPGRAAAVTAILLGVWYFASGLAVDAFFGDHVCISVLDPRELTMGLFIWLFWAPTIVFYYLWQPKGARELAMGIEGNRLLDSRSAIAGLREGIGTAFRSPIPVLVGLVGAVAATLLEVLVIERRTASELGAPSFWFAHWSVTVLVFCPAFAVFAYMLIAFVSRNLVLAWKLHRLFLQYRDTLCPKIFHPDRCGGMASLGRFALRLGLLAVAFGLFAALLGLRPLLFGGRPMLNGAVIAMYCIYVALVPICIVPCVWSAHRAMAQFRRKCLSELCGQIQVLIIKTVAGSEERGTSTRHHREIEALVKEYDLLSARVPVWPISLPSLKSFGVTAALPLALATVQVVLELGNRFNWF